jgi:cobalt/nickel transport system permease protein
MKHSFLDKYSDGDSVVHRLDPRTKLVGAFLFVLAVSLTQPGNWSIFGAYFVIIAVPIIISRVPVQYVLKRSLVIIPFVLLIAIFIPFFRDGEVAWGFSVGSWRIDITRDGLLVMWTVLAKAWLAILSLVLLTTTTKINDLLKGMEQMSLPRVMVMILSFMYRYIFVLTDEVMRMKQARDSRNFGGSRWWQAKTIGTMAGTLFIRSYERGERVYNAMLSRGYDGQTRTLRQLSLRRSDILFGAVFGALIVAACIANYVIHL